MELFGHPFSSYTWKALIPLYENGTNFTFRNVDPSEPGNYTELARRWPLAKFPLLVDGDRQIFETSAIIDYLEVFHPGAARMIPSDPWDAVKVRQLDRVLDNYVMNVAQVLVSNAMRPDEHRDTFGLGQAKDNLDKIYSWLDSHLAGRRWAVGDTFTLADCAAAPALFYSDWAHPILATHANLKAYRARLLARPSVKRCVEDARPYRRYFPLGAPDRD
ncbi:glutathione S-transferase family protein [Sphingomonas quercus]|uniref:Glutathione S-transferase family protein n=1 Tax=Sphingomonas quercus TaxID=2842451 RepID=A0ABS6BJB4_9SPHN|nr:glutathione S-transferase family protein [Sphingomonas quercus]MBU3077707.1 glutathione S-transferase family protein [Sphingomonas quercus]